MSYKSALYFQLRKPPKRDLYEHERLPYGIRFCDIILNWMVKSAEYFFSDTGKAQIILKDINNVYYFGALKYFFTAEEAV